MFGRSGVVGGKREGFGAQFASAASSVTMEVAARAREVATEGVATEKSGAGVEKREVETLIAGEGRALRGAEALILRRPRSSSSSSESCSTSIFSHCLSPPLRERGSSFMAGSRMDLLIAGKERNGSGPCAHPLVREAATFTVLRLAFLSGRPTVRAQPIGSFAAPPPTDKVGAIRLCRHGTKSALQPVGLPTWECTWDGRPAQPRLHSFLCESPQAKKAFSGVYSVLQGV